MTIVRELVLDTETTGLSSEKGDKIVEVGIVELINHIPTENYFHKYINPKRQIPESAFKIHGLSFDFLKDKPLFSDIAEEMLAFIGNDPIIIHNAVFDTGFLNKELLTNGFTPIESSQIIDTLILARDKFPGSPASLDALCRRFSIDNSRRELHGALLDSYILAQVYLELIGGNQPILDLVPQKKAILTKTVEQEKGFVTFQRALPLPRRITSDEAKAHKEFISNINGLKNWSIYD